MTPEVVATSDAAELVTSEHSSSHLMQTKEHVMTYSTSLKATTTPVAQLAVGTTLASFAFNALGIYGDGTSGDDHSTSEFLVVCGVAVVAAVIVFGLVVPSTLGKPSSGRTALVLAILAVLTVPVFWAGVTPALGVGAIILGLSGDRRTLSRIGVALGALALMGYVVTYLLDWLSTNAFL